MIFFSKQKLYKKNYFQAIDNRIVSESLYDNENIIKEIMSSQNATNFIETYIDPIKTNINRHNVTVLFKLLQPNSICWAKMVKFNLLVWMEIQPK